MLEFLNPRLYILQDWPAPLCFGDKGCGLLLLVRRWTSWLRSELKGSISHLGEAEMSSFLCDTITGIPTGAWGQQCYHFHASQPSYVGCTVSGWFPLSATSYSKWKEQQQARRASSSPDLPNWLESHWGIFILEQIFCPKGLGIRIFLFTLLSWECCKLYFVIPLICWTCLVLLDHRENVMVYSLSWKSDCGKYNEPRWNLILFYFPLYLFFTSNINFNLILILPKYGKIKNKAKVYL